LLFPKVGQRRDELVVAVLQQPVQLVIHVGEEGGELLERVGDDDLVVGERGADAVELEPIWYIRFGRNLRAIRDNDKCTNSAFYSVLERLDNIILSI
jgi:hypothetical protein